MSGEGSKGEGVCGGGAGWGGGGVRAEGAGSTVSRRRASRAAPPVQRAKQPLPAEDRSPEDAHEQHVPGPADESQQGNLHTRQPGWAGRLGPWGTEATCRPVRTAAAGGWQSTVPPAAGGGHCDQQAQSHLPGKCRRASRRRRSDLLTRKHGGQSNERCARRASGPRHAGCGMRGLWVQRAARRRSRRSSSSSRHPTQHQS